MSEGKKKSATEAGKRQAKKSQPPSQPDRGENRPPESAEDFKHVLRRLIAAKDRGGGGA